MNDHHPRPDRYGDPDPAETHHCHGGWLDDIRTADPPLRPCPVCRPETAERVRRQKTKED